MGKQINKNNQEQQVPVLPEREAKGKHDEIPEGMKVLSEGMANVLYEISKQREVFYNPAMETNRDISIAMVNVFIKILEKEAAQTKKKKILTEDAMQGNSCMNQFPIVVMINL